MIAESFTWLPSHVGISFENSLKIYSVDFTIQQWYLSESKKKKKKNEKKISKFLFLTLSSIFKICQSKQETLKEYHVMKVCAMKVCTMKLCANWIICLKRLSLILSSVLGNHSHTSVTKVGSLFCTRPMLPFNSKIGSYTP